MAQPSTNKSSACNDVFYIHSSLITQNILPAKQCLPLQKKKKLAGIYIHIPFCKQACHYCNFHFSTSMKSKGSMVDAIIKEIDIRKDFLLQKDLTSIYFGGGTPSLLDKEELEKIFSALAKHFTWSSNAEITLEANPDDLDSDKLKTLKDVGVNRLSIGIQSFADEDLLYMNRAHDSTEAKKCIQNAQDAGFYNISADLIYGSPSTTNHQWEKNIDKLLAYDIPHISAYALTVEEGTALHHFIKTGKTKPVDEDTAARQFDILVDRLDAGGFDHYEISNFALPDHYAVHNSNYWKGEPYLGLGPAAHSFNGKDKRLWNMAHNAKYIQEIKNGKLPIEEETLSPKDQYNEFVLIRLRTIWGIPYQELIDNHYDFLPTFMSKATKLISEGYLLIKDDNYILTRKGKLMADRISSELFHEE